MDRNAYPILTVLIIATTSSILAQARMLLLEVHTWSLHGENELAHVQRSVVRLRMHLC